jgi:hypothetical protein
MKKEFFMLGSLLFVIIYSCIIVKYGRQIHKTQTCENLKDFKKEEYFSVVSKKFIDEKNHCFRTINFRNREPWVLVDDTTSFFDIIERNDSLVKKAGSDTIAIFRDRSVFKFKIYFGCIE